MSAFKKITEQATEMLLRAFAEEISKHALKKNMTPEEILNLIDLTSKQQPIESDDEQSSDADDGKLDLGDIPKGISEKSVLEILKLAKLGVPKGDFIHLKSRKVVSPSKSNSKFYRNEDARIFGPRGKDDINVTVIDWLAEKIGTVEDPPEDKVDAAVPLKWIGNESKKAKALLDKVTEKGDVESQLYINYKSNRPIDMTKGKNSENYIMDDTYGICGPKSDKAELVNLIAWLDEHPNAGDDLPVRKRTPKKKVADSEDSADEEPKVEKKKVEKKKVEKKKVEKKKVEKKKVEKKKVEKKVVIQEPEDTEESDDTEEMSGDDGTTSDDGDEDDDDVEVENVDDDDDEDDEDEDDEDEDEDDEEESDDDEDVMLQVAQKSKDISSEKSESEEDDEDDESQSEESEKKVPVKGQKGGRKGNRRF